VKHTLLSAFLSDVLTLTETTFSVQDFFNGSEVSKDLTSSTTLLTSRKIPTVLHFYDGG
jgi:hypothetical protein